MKRICVFTGSNPGARPEYIAAAKALAQEIVSRNWELVYGGANVGLMGVIADAVIQLGGRVTGVIPKALVEKEIAHNGLSELRVVQSMHERKAQMFKLSCGFVALPGGLGTIEEMFEVLTWAQLGSHDKPCGLLNVCEYYDRLMSFLDHAVCEGFLKSVHKSMLLIEENPKAILDKIEQYQAPKIEKWIDRVEI